MVVNLLTSNLIEGHSAVLHGCTVEDEAFVGMGATLLDGAVVEKNAMVAAGALVRQNTRIPSGEVCGNLNLSYSFCYRHRYCLEHASNFQCEY